MPNSITSSDACDSWFSDNLYEIPILENYSESNDKSKKFNCKMPQFLKDLLSIAIPAIIIPCIIVAICFML